MGQGQVSDQSGASWYPVITASSYKVAVLIMSLVNYVTQQYTNATQNTPHKISPGVGLQSLIAPFFVLEIHCPDKSFWFFFSYSEHFGEIKSIIT